MTEQTASLPARADAARGPALHNSVPRSVPQLRADIEDAQRRLAVTMEQIADRVKPANVASRLSAKAKAQVVDPVSGPRYPRIAAAGGVVMLIVLIRVLRARRRRR